MNNLDNLTVNFIELHYLDIEKPAIYEGFSLLYLFSVQHYEGKYIDLIANSDSMHSEDLVTSFSQLLITDLAAIIRDHYITLNDANIRLSEIVSMVFFLHLMQSMESYENVGYRLFGDDTPRDILIDLIASYSTLDKWRVMEMISDVDPALIYAIQQLIEDKEIEDSNSHVASDILVKFINYIGATSTLGNALINKSVVDIELKDLGLVLDIDLVEHVDGSISSHKTQTVLDILSVLLLCKDSQNDPMGAFKEHSHLFTDKPENVTAIEPLLRRMYGDFISKTQEQAAAPSSHIEE